MQTIGVKGFCAFFTKYCKKSVINFIFYIDNTNVKWYHYGVSLHRACYTLFEASSMHNSGILSEFYNGFHLSSEAKW